MKNKILYCLNFLWTGIIAFSFPICLGWIYMNITGHSKGYSYDLGDEAGISILFGCIELLIWLALALPSIIYILKKTAKKNAAYVFIPIVIYVLLFLLCIYLIGGFGEFGKFFHG